MKTVKVRIAVCVAPSGRWNSCGYFSKSDDDKFVMESAAEVYDDEGEPECAEARYWVEAEIVIPEPKPVAGKVTPA